MPTKKKPAKKPRGRPQVLEGEVRVLTVRLSQSTYSDLERLAAQRTIDTGATVRLSDVVRAAIESELNYV